MVERSLVWRCAAARCDGKLSRRASANHGARVGASYRCTYAIGIIY